MPSKRERRRALLADEAQPERSPVDRKLIRWGSPRRAADRCTMTDAPAQFGLCLECPYNGGAHNDGLCVCIASASTRRWWMAHSRKCAVTRSKG